MIEWRGLEGGFEAIDALIVNDGVNAAFGKFALFKDRLRPLLIEAPDELLNGLRMSSNEFGDLGGGHTRGDKPQAMPALFL